MARMNMIKPPAALKMKVPKAEVDAIPLARKPLATSGGKDIISITTRMKETPTKMGKK